MRFYSEMKRLNEEIKQAELDLRDAEQWAADGGESEFRSRMVEVQKQYDLLMSLRHQLADVVAALGRSEDLEAAKDQDAIDALGSDPDAVINGSVPF